MKNNVLQKHYPFGYISKLSDQDRIKYTIKGDNNLDPQRSDLIRDVSRSSFAYGDDCSRSNILNSSLQRWRPLPKTYKKADYYNKSTNWKLTVPLPFSLSKSNYNRPKVGDKERPKQFKAKKVPDMTFPFMIYKNDKELTVFQEFELATSRRDYSLEKTSVHQKSYNNLLSGASIYNQRVTKTPRSNIQVKFASFTNKIGFWTFGRLQNK